MPRFEVNSEQIRGERRCYWVHDNQSKREAVEGSYTQSERSAQLWAWKLNNGLDPRKRLPAKDKQ